MRHLTALKRPQTGMTSKLALIEVNPVAIDHQYGHPESEPLFVGEIKERKFYILVCWLAYDRTAKEL